MRFLNVYDLAPNNPEEIKHVIEKDKTFIGSNASDLAEVTATCNSEAASTADCMVVDIASEKVEIAEECISKPLEYTDESKSFISEETPNESASFVTDIKEFTDIVHINDNVNAEISYVISSKGDVKMQIDGVEGETNAINVGEAAVKPIIVEAGMESSKEITDQSMKSIDNSHRQTSEDSQTVINSNPYTGQLPVEIANNVQSKVEGGEAPVLVESTTIKMENILPIPTEQPFQMKNISISQPKLEKTPSKAQKKAQKAQMLPINSSNMLHAPVITPLTPNGL
jgi:hypothetical protein